MRVLLDGNVPSKLARLLSGHDARTIHQEGWSNLSNGALLDAAGGRYDVFLTLDQNLSYQQNLRDRRSPLSSCVLAPIGSSTLSRSCRRSCRRFRPHSRERPPLWAHNEALLLSNALISEAARALGARAAMFIARSQQNAGAFSWTRGRLARKQPFPQTVGMAKPKSIKPDAQRLVDQLSDDATWDDLAYEVYVRQAIEAGLADVEAGRTLSHEDAIKQIRARIRRAS